MLVLLLVPALTAALAVGAAVLVGTKPVTSPQSRPWSLVWAGRVFTSKRDFAAWLRSRGRTYDAWAKSHPDAAPWGPRASGGPADARGRRTPPASHSGKTRLPVGVLALLATGLAAAVAIIAVVRRAAARRWLARSVVGAGALLVSAAKALPRQIRRTRPRARRHASAGGLGLGYAVAAGLLSIGVGIAIPLLLH